MRKSRSIVLAALVLLLAACSHGQRISIRTDPAGALVSLQRMGTQTISGSVAGVGGGSVDGGRFTDDWLSLGNAPVEYEFDLSESGGGGYVAGTGAKVTKHYREGMVRVELAGYQTQERRVAFRGDAIDLVFTLRQVGSLP